MSSLSPEQYIIELEHRVAILTRLTEISTVMNSTMKIKQLLAYLLDSAAEITNAEAASVLLWDRKTDTLRFAATTTDGTGAKIIGKEVPLAESIAGVVLREQRVMAVNDVRRNTQHYNKIDEDIAFQTRSVLGVPMLIKDRAIGVLEAINRRKLPWTADDERNLSILAAQAAVAIEAAQLVSRLEKANEELANLDQMKNDFIALASHELRTPLGVILGYASFLQESQDAEVNDSASKVVESALQLRRIIEDLTNLRYIQQNESELFRQPLMLDELVRDVLPDMQALADAKGHQLTVDVQPQLALQVDRIRMNMALSNLIMNAIRFTPNNGAISIRSIWDGRGEVWLAIQDNGIGLERDQLERIFKKFYQVEDHRIRHHGGLGIGLSIAQAVVKAHGGRIWAESGGLNQGATFTVALPMAGANDEKRSTRA
jgi:signal transduction histidine kinase